MDFYADELDSLRFFVCGVLTADNGFIHIRRVLDCHVLIMVLEGTLYITQNGCGFAVGAGETILLAEGLEHFGTRRCEGHLSYLWVHFRTDTQWHTEPPANFACRLPESFRTTNMPRLRRIFELMTDYSRRPAADEMTLCALRLLLLECASQADEHCPQVSPLVGEVSSWIRRSCHRRLTVGEIAEHFHYSPDHLSAVFRRETGMPLSVFLNSCRMELARSLLENSSVSIKETACSCGFSDEKYFARAFRRETGMSPSEYRDSKGSAV